MCPDPLLVAARGSAASLARAFADAVLRLPVARRPSAVGAVRPLSRCHGGRLDSCQAAQAEADRPCDGSSIENQRSSLNFMSYSMNQFQTGRTTDSPRR